MNQLNNGKRITLTSKPSILSSNEKISLSASTPSISTTIDSSSKLLISTSLNSSNLSHSLPSSPLPSHTPNSIGVVPLSSTHIKDKIVVSTSSESESNSVHSELVSEPTQVKTHIRRPLVSYDEEDSKGSSPEPQSESSNSVKEEVNEETLEEKEKSEEGEEATTLSEADCASSAAPLDAAVEDQKPSTSSASTSADPSSAEQSQKPKTKRVRISLKLDQLSVLRLERLASENPKLLKKLGLKAYRINNFNGSSKRFQIIRVPNPVPRPSESSLANPSSQQQQLRGLRRPSRAPSASSIGVVSFPPPSPTPRFRAPYPHQRNISAFEYSKGNPPVTPAFPMDRTQQLQPQQFQYPYSSQQQQQPQRPPRYSSPAPPSMPPQQQQQQQQIPQQPQQQSIRPTQMQEPGPSNNCDSPLLVNLLSNNSQQPPQQPMQQQIRYQTPQQQQQMSHQMMSVQQQQHQGYPLQQMQPNMHMMQQQQYPTYPQHRMPGPGNMGPGGMQQMGGQPPPHMMPPQGIPPQQQVQAQQPVPQEAPKKRKRPSKKKKEEDQAKAEAAAAAQAAQMEQRRLMQQQQQPPQMQEYYMMHQTRMPQQVPRHMQQAMPPNYAGYHGYPQGQPSTSMMAPGYPPQHGYPQPSWNPHEYQYNMPMMRPQGQPQNPGTPTSGYPPPHQSPGYPSNATAAAVQQQQQQKVKTPNYPQPSPQYTGAQTPQQAMNRQFMSPQNHPSPGYQQPPQQFGYPQPTQPQQSSQQQQQATVNRQGQPQQQPNSQQQNTSGGLEDYGSFHDYNGASLEDLAATFGDLGGEDCDLDSITPMNTDPMIPHQQQHQAQQQQMMQQNQQGIMHPQQQQQQQMPSYDQQHQFVAPHMPQHQQSAMGPPQGYYQQMPGHNQQQQDMQGHFQRPPSAGHPSHMQMYMHHQQAQQQQQHHQQQVQQQQQVPQQQQVHQQQAAPAPPPQNDKPPNGKNEDGYTTPFDADIKSPSKINVEQQGKIMITIDDVMSKIRNNDKAYFDNITTQWNNNPNGDDPPPASATTNKRKAKSTSSRPPSRQPKNSQPSSAAATPTSGPGPFFGGNSTGTEPSTPIKEETIDFKQERKNSTLSSLLSGSSTPTTIKCEENGHPETISASSLSSSIVKTESRDTETPQSVTSGITEPEHTVASISPTTNPPPQIDAGVLKVEGNGSNNNHGSQTHQQLYNGVPSTTATTSPHENDNTVVSLKSDNTVPSSVTSATGDIMPPPRKIRKTESSPTAVEDYYPGESEISTTATTS